MVVFYSRLRDIGPRERHRTPWRGPDPAHVVHMKKYGRVRTAVRSGSRQDFHKKQEFRRNIGTLLKNTLVHRPSFVG